ncbi:hypothetical protein [Desulfovibrio subterraneus]|nr:hypothetical protein [Desulfovibrio subterraneus]
MSGFYLADAVLPQSSLGQIRTGDEAESERIHSGLQWPPEARVLPEKPLRRVPIPVAWSLLVDAGDRTVRWEGGRGNSIPLASILAAHVKGLLEENDFTYSNQDQAVVAIPDHLDEYGQEALLQAFGSNRSQVSLLWRPVAAAMTWLDAAKPTNLEQDDFLLVIYLGPDGMDFTTFGLREEKCNGRTYVLPVRNRPSRAPLPPGWEWACALSAEADPLCRDDYGAFWQTFTTFPEVWAAIAGAPWDNEDLPRPWSTSQGWRLWDPAPVLNEKVLDCGQGQSAILRKLLKGSCKLTPADRKSSGETWGEHLKAELKATLATQPGRLRGAILCGPIAPRQIPRWLNPEELGLLPDTEPRPDTLWMASACDDPVALGARLYGERLAAGLPTYLDTLPGLALLTQRQGGLDWVDIVESSECPGGQPYTRNIPDRFFLPKKSSSMLVYLKKEMRSNEEKKPEKPVSSYRPEFISPIESRVKSLGSLEEVLNSQAWDLNYSARNYALSYAEWLFWKPDLSKSPFRHGSVEFPSSPSKDVPLTINVEMRPASGLARVEFVPEKENALKGRSAAFDFSRMAPLAEEELPEPQLRWPETLHFETTLDPKALDDRRIRDFIQLPQNVIDKIFIRHLESMKAAICAPAQDSHRKFSAKRIDENGNAGSPQGCAIVSQIADRIEQQSQHFLASKQIFMEDNTRIFIVRSSWLWAATPQVVTGYIEEFISNHKYHDATWNHIIESASRCFTKETQFKLLCKIIHKRSSTGRGNSFPIQSMRSLSRILVIREQGWRGLDSDMARHFADRAADIICDEVKSNNIKQKFFQGVFLILALLRFRATDPSFLDPVNQSSVFRQIEDCFREGIEIARRQGNAEKVQLIKKTIDFMYSKGCKGIISQVASQAGE